jgi:hypothetical protein
VASPFQHFDEETASRSSENAQALCECRLVSVRIDHTSVDAATGEPSRQRPTVIRPLPTVRQQERPHALGARIRALRDDFLKCEIAGIESELSAGHPIPASFIGVQLGSKTWPFCGSFGCLIGVRATESMGLRV